MWEVYGWIRLVFQTLIDIWLICILLSYAMEIPSAGQKVMPGVKQSDKAEGDVEMANVSPNQVGEEENKAN